MRRRGVEVEIALFDVLTVISFVTGEAEQTFLQNRINTIPQGQAEAESTLPIREAEQPVFAPAVSAPCGIVVREVIPDAAIGGIILANRSPLAFGEVRAPALPVRFGKPSRFGRQPASFRGCRLRLMQESLHPIIPADNTRTDEWRLPVS